ncbi:unnamed protein product [Prunus brigantina]
MSRDSRHRRQLSQVLPPEFIAGDDLHDLAQGSILAAGTATTTTTESSKNSPPKAHGQDSSTHSPAPNKKPPTPRPSGT